jgi:hypothetical protein
MRYLYDMHRISVARTKRVAAQGIWNGIFEKCTKEAVEKSPSPISNSSTTLEKVNYTSVNLPIHENNRSIIPHQQNQNLHQSRP